MYRHKAKQARVCAGVESSEVYVARRMSRGATPTGFLRIVGMGVCGGDGDNERVGLHHHRILFLWQLFGDSLVIPVNERSSRTVQSHHRRPFHAHHVIS